MKLPQPSVGELIGGSYFLNQFNGPQRKGRPAGQFKTMWNMKCGCCGSEYSVEATQQRHAAKNGKKRFCPNRHLHTGISIGDRFNKTVVVAWAPPEHFSDHRWGCKLQCDCGTVHYGRPDQLKRGDIQSCGCRRAQCTSEARTTHGLSGSTQYKMFCGAKMSAEKQGLPVDIDLEDCEIPEFCPVLGIKFEEGNSGERTHASPSLDKFYPEKGYVKGNVRVISWLANNIKTNARAADVLKVAQWMQRVEDGVA